MYNSQKIANRIKEQAKIKGVVLKVMLSDCGLGINLISHLAKGQAMTYVNFAKIADYLNCSVDYLLGRTDNPNIEPPSNFSGNSVTNTNSKLGDNSGNLNILNSNETNADKKDEEILGQISDWVKIFQDLNFENRIKILASAIDLKEKQNSAK